MKFSDYFLLEKKDHIINKIPSLSDEQKQAIIAYFTKKPNMESKINWNKWKELTYDDFREVLTTTSKSEVKKKVHRAGIAGLKEGVDYRVFPMEKPDVVGYVPLTWEASKHIASSSIGGCEGKWCTAYQKTEQYWHDYVISKKVVLVYLIVSPQQQKLELGDEEEEDIKGTKFAIAIYPNNDDYEIYNARDQKIDEYGMNDELPDGSEIDVATDILEHTAFLNEVREYIAENTPPAELTDAELQELAEDYATNVSTEFRGVEEAINAARGIIDSEYNGLTGSWDENLSAEQLKDYIQGRFGEWESGYDTIMKYMEEKHSIDPENLQNKINALSYSNWGADEDPAGAYSSDFRNRLLELDWKYLYSKSYDEMIQRFYDEDYRSFDDLDEEYLKKWLEYAYENNHEDFVRFKENFVNDFNEVIGIAPGGYGTLHKLTDGEIEYINNLVKKVESAGYKKVKDQMALNLDSVGSHRYLNKVLLGS